MEYDFIITAFFFLQFESFVVVFWKGVGLKYF